MTAWAARESSQKAGSWDCSVRLAISACILGKSKTHLEVLDAGAEALDGLVEVFG